MIIIDSLYYMKQSEHLIPVELISTQVLSLLDLKLFCYI